MTFGLFKSRKHSKVSGNTQTEPQSPEIPRIRIEPPDTHVGPCCGHCIHLTERKPLPPLPKNRSQPRPFGTSNVRDEPCTSPAATNAESTATSSAKLSPGGSFTDMLAKAKESGLPVIVVNVTNNCPTPATTPPKVDVTLPECHNPRTDEQNDGQQDQSMYLESTPRQNHQSALFDQNVTLDTSSSALGNMSVLTDPGCAGIGAAGKGTRSRPQSMGTSSPQSICLPSVSALSLDGDEDERLLDDDEETPGSLDHTRQLIHSASDAMVQVVSASRIAMKANDIAEEQTTYMETCSLISRQVQTLGTIMNQRDADKEDEHRRLQSEWHFNFQRRIGSLERSLEVLINAAQMILNTCNPSESDRKPLRQATFERWNSRLKEYAVKLESLNSKFKSALERMEVGLLRRQLDDASEETRQARLDLHKACTRYQSAEVHQERLKHQMDTINSRRRHRRHSLCS